MVKITDEVIRIAYRAFGVTVLDGLEVFKRLSHNYVIVNKDSILCKQISEKQEKVF